MILNQGGSNKRDEQCLKGLQDAVANVVDGALAAEIDTEAIVNAFETALKCKHSRCDNQRRNISVLDDHDSSVGTYYLTSFCSLECFVCHLKHKADFDANLAELVEKEIWS
jgi:hypothetical protein